MRRLFVMLILAPFLLGGTMAMAQSGHLMRGPDEIKWVDAPPSLPRGATVAVIEGKPSEPGRAKARNSAGVRCKLRRALTSGLSIE